MTRSRRRFPRRDPDDPAPGPRRFNTTDVPPPPRFWCTDDPRPPPRRRRDLSPRGRSAKGGGAAIRLADVPGAEVCPVDGRRRRRDPPRGDVPPPRRRRDPPSRTDPRPPPRRLCNSSQRRGRAAARSSISSARRWPAAMSDRSSSKRRSRLAAWSMSCSRTVRSASACFWAASAPARVLRFAAPEAHRSSVPFARRRARSAFRTGLASPISARSPSPRTIRVAESTRADTPR